MDLKDPNINIPNLSWLSDCHRFLRDREWESKNIFDVEPVLSTESELQKKEWENVDYVEGLHFKFKNGEVDENVA